VTTLHSPGNQDNLGTAAAFPGPQHPVFAAALKSCPVCGIESTEELCFNCGRPLVDEATYGWLRSPNPTHSEC
jgi:hypothetical protein